MWRDVELRAGRLPQVETKLSSSLFTVISSMGIMFSWAPPAG